MIQNFKYLLVFTSAPGGLPEQNDRYRIQPWKVNEIKAYNNNEMTTKFSISFFFTIFNEKVTGRRQFSLNKQILHKHVKNGKIRIFIWILDDVQIFIRICGYTD